MNTPILITGPTASGKKKIALALAEDLGAEIVSVDSMKIYREMDIGTDKPSPEARKRVRHHLIDVVGPDESYSTGQYLADAEKAVGDIESRGGTPLFAGGTALYIKALAEGIFDGPPADWDFRTELQAEAERNGKRAIYGKLARIDPEAAAKIHPNDLRRIKRALEVHHLTGRKMSELQAEDRALRAKASRRSILPVRFEMFAVDYPRDALYEKINARVDAMFEEGFIAEVEGLLAKYGALSREASKALGYREAIAYLSGGPDLEETIELVKQHTRNFAKRQETWFRSFPDLVRIPAGETPTPESLAGRITAYLNGES